MITTESMANIWQEIYLNRSTPLVAMGDYEDVVVVVVSFLFVAALTIIPGFVMR